MHEIWLVVLTGLALAACGDDGGSHGGWNPTGPSPDDCDSVDTATDTYHCGACGHTCWGGECAAGVCREVRLLGNPKAVAEGVAVYGSSHSVENGPTTDINVQPLETYFSYPTPIVLTTDQADDREMTIADGYVYWSAVDGVYRASFLAPPNNAEKILDAAPVMGTTFAFTQLLVIGGTMVMAPPIPGILPPEVPKLLQCAVGSCASPSTIYTGAIAGANIDTLVGDGTYLAWTEGPDVRGCEVANCMATARTLAAGVLDLNRSRHPLAIGDHKVAWGDDTHAAAMICDYGDCTTPTVALAKYTYDLVIHAGSIFIDAEPTVMKCALAGCATSSEPVPFVTYNEKIFVTDEFYIHGNGRIAR